MIWIESVGRKRRRSINVSGDNILLISVFLATAVSYFPYSLITATLALLLITLCTEVFSSLRLYRLRARPLRPEQAPALFAIIAREAKVMDIKKFVDRPNVKYIPTALQATAFTLGGFSSKLVVTGRLIVAAETVPDTIGLIVRHEFAHIANSDQRMWFVFVCSFLGIIPTLALFVISLLGITQALGPALVGLFLGVSFTFILFRRREYLADARTVNYTADRGSYLELLRGGSTFRHSWFHPSRDARIAALECGSPVLQSNLLMIIITALFAAASIDYVRSKYDSAAFNHRDDVLGLPLSLFLVLVVFLVPTIMEFAKGIGRKIPLPATSEPILQSPRPDYPSRLATVFGVGGRKIRSGRIIGFVCATGAMWTFINLFDWVIRNPRYSLAPMPFKTYLPPPLFILMWCATYLIALWFSPSLLEVGTVMGIVGVLMFASRTGEGAADQFVFNLAGVILLGVCVKRFRNAWVGLWLGTAVDNVLRSAPRWNYWKGMLAGGEWFEGLAGFALREVWGVIAAIVFASIFVLVAKVTTLVVKEG